MVTLRLSRSPDRRNFINVDKRGDLWSRLLTCLETSEIKKRRLRLSRSLDRHNFIDVYEREDLRSRLLNGPSRRLRTLETSESIILRLSRSPDRRSKIF